MLTCQRNLRREAKAPPPDAKLRQVAEFSGWLQQQAQGEDAGAARMDPPRETRGKHECR